MQVDRVDVTPKDTSLLTSRDQIAQGINDSSVELLDCFGPAQVGTVQNVLVHDQAHELRMRILIVEGERYEGP